MTDDNFDQNEPIYLISVVSKMIDMHPQTLRMYERQGLIKPKRVGSVRMFSASDIKRLQQIVRLRDELGVNAAGIVVILNLLEQIDDLQTENERIRAQSKRRLQKFF